MCLKIFEKIRMLKNIEKIWGDILDDMEYEQSEWRTVEIGPAEIESVEIIDVIREI